MSCGLREFMAANDLARFVGAPWNDTGKQGCLLYQTVKPGRSSARGCQQCMFSSSTSGVDRGKMQFYDPQGGNCRPAPSRAEPRPAAERIRTERHECRECRVPHNRIRMCVAARRSGVCGGR